MGAGGSGIGRVTLRQRAVAVHTAAGAGAALHIQEWPSGTPLGGAVRLSAGARGRPDSCLRPPAYIVAVPAPFYGASPSAARAENCPRGMQRGMNLCASWCAGDDRGRRPHVPRSRALLRRTMCAPSHQRSTARHPPIRLALVPLRRCSPERAPRQLSPTLAAIVAIPALRRLNRAGPVSAFGQRGLRRHPRTTRTRGSKQGPASARLGRLRAPPCQTARACTLNPAGGLGPRE